MIRPTKHPKTGVYRARLAIPAHLRPTAKELFRRSAEFIENLDTMDCVEARVRAVEASARLLDQNDEWAVQRERHMSLEAIAPMSDDQPIKLPAVAA